MFPIELGSEGSCDSFEKLLGVAFVEGEGLNEEVLQRRQRFGRLHLGKKCRAEPAAGYRFRLVARFCIVR